ncbi:hypothetical protein [Paenibacillus macerans]|uniref:hypothetical protein n=1 Tax=Paenibacillus macerans TaxID=44252 RepID=UPI003D317B8A
MTKRWKDVLQAAFAAPEPADKERFLKTLRYPKISYSDFFLSQFRYIRKRVWALSALIAAVGWAIALSSPLDGHWHAEAGRLWTLSAILPFLALLTATELSRSMGYRMAELELSCRFSLPQIVMARAAILGGGNFLVLALLLTLISQRSSYGLLQAAAYLLVPYLMTCGFCLLIVNRVRGRESLYGCAAAACLVSMTNVVVGSALRFLYSNAFLGYWLLLFAASSLLIGIQLRYLHKRTEERTWDLFLTE